MSEHVDEHSTTSAAKQKKNKQKIHHCIRIKKVKASIYKDENLYKKLKIEALGSRLDKQLDNNFA